MIKRLIKLKAVNSAFLTFEEYKLLKSLIPHMEKPYNAFSIGIKSFQLKTNIKIIQESPYFFYDIKDNKMPIFILLHKPIYYLPKGAQETFTERIYKSGGLKYYYEYNGKKYFQRQRLHEGFKIWTSDGTNIYPYVTQKELKPRLKVRGFKRIAKKVGTNNYVSKPFRITHQEKKLRGK